MASSQQTQATSEVEELKQQPEQQSVTIDFDHYFPTLMSEMNSFDENTNLCNLQHDLDRDHAGNQLYDVEMVNMLERVDEEVVRVIG